MSFPRYAEYRDFVCRGEIIRVPAHWNVGGLTKYLDSVVDYRGRTPTKVDDGVYLVTARNIKDGRIDYSLSEEFIAGDEYERVMSRGAPAFGDVLFTTEAPLGQVANIDRDDIALAQRIIKFRGRSNSLDNYFLKYWIMGDSCQEVLLRLATGSTAVGIKGSKIGQIPIALPPLEEQRAIAAFLDRETSKIDALVAEQRRLIALLKEKRQAVISHAVTKGLDPTVKLKDSGIEWLGQVPEHWEVGPLKYSCSLIKDGTHLPPPRVDDGVPLLSVRNLIDEKFTYRDDDSMISREDYEELCRSFVPVSGDILLAIVGATLGKTAVVSNQMREFHVQRSLCVFRTDDQRVLPLFLNFVFRSRQFQTKLWELVGYSAQPGIYLNTLRNLPVPLPPLLEQAAILEKTNHQISRIEDLLRDSEAAVHILMVRRSAIISAAVTGKIDVYHTARRAN